MIPPSKISIISKTSHLSFEETVRVAAAIQQQVIHHFAPVWKVSAVITALQDPQPGYAPIFIMDTINQPGIMGVHQLEDGSPYAVVRYGPTWSLWASHECLEMILDPGLDRKWHAILPGPDPRPVDYILEVCDPCQSIECAYRIDNFFVSDFYLPSFFDQMASPGTSYSFNKSIKGPKEISVGGTLSWIDSDQHAYLATNTHGSVKIQDCGPFVPGPMAAREFMSRFDRSCCQLSHAKCCKALADNIELCRRAASRATDRYVKRFDIDLARRVRECSMSKNLEPKAKRKMKKAARRSQTRIKAKREKA